MTEEQDPVQEHIKEIEDEIARTQYNKATEKHIGKLKAKMALLRAQASKSGGKKGVGYSVKKGGDATILLVGFPSVGKSTLLNQLTNADSKIGDYDFTTLDVIPGVMEYHGAKLQILDVPGMVEGAASGKGRGKEILSVIRSADLILIMTEIESLGNIDIIKKELYDAGFRLNKSPPDVKVQKKSTGGLSITGAETSGLSRDTVVSVLNEFGVINADVIIREKITLDRLIDSVMKNRIHIPAIIIVNKADKKPTKINSDFVYISALKGTGIDELKKLIWQKLDFMRLYMKKPGKEPDMKEPLILKKDSTIEDVCNWVHGDLKGRFKSARIWGPSAKFPGQEVGIRHRLLDKDIMELRVD